MRLSGLRDELTLLVLSFELSFAEPSLLELSFEELSEDELSLAELSRVELSFDELSFDEPSDLDFSSFFESFPPPSEAGA